MNRIDIAKRGFVVTTLAIGAIAAAPVLARDGSASASNNTVSNTTGEHSGSDTADTTTNTQTEQEHTQAETAVKKAHQDELVQEKLTDEKKKSCDAHSAEIKTRAANFTKHVNDQLGVFDRIAKKVEDFATANNKKPSNYDALVADLATKRAVVTTDLATLNTDATAFSCTGTNPKAELTAIVSDAKAVRAALKGYRDSVRSLLVAVKSLTGTTESSDKSNNTTNTGGTQ